MRNRTGLYSLLLVGGFFIWRNRSGIQQFFAQQGIKIPLLSDGSIGDDISAGASKAVGSLEHGVRSLEGDTRKAV